MCTAARDIAPALILTRIGMRIGARTLLADISMMIHQGRIHGLVGPNGSGKTSLLRLLAGIWRAHTGHIERHHGSLDRIGYVPQRFCLYDELTVRENLRFQARMRGAESSTVSRVEAQFGLRELGDRRASALSGGQRQSLLIAAALLHRPTLLVCDEPTTALDQGSRKALWKLLRNEADAGTTIVLATHEEADARECDAFTRLHEGRIVADGLVKEGLPP